MRLPRMTTRRWMITVMILGTLMGVWIEAIRELRLAAQYRRRAGLCTRSTLLARPGPEFDVGVLAGADCAVC
jgi:hypothetical protein